MFHRCCYHDTDVPSVPWCDAGLGVIGGSGGGQTAGFGRSGGGVRERAARGWRAGIGQGRRVTSGMGGFAILSDRRLRARLDRRAWYERACQPRAGLSMSELAVQRRELASCPRGRGPGRLATGPAWRSHGPTGLISNRDALGMAARTGSGQSLAGPDSPGDHRAGQRSPSPAGGRRLHHVRRHPPVGAAGTRWWRDVRRRPLVLQGCQIVHGTLDDSPAAAGRGSARGDAPAHGSGTGDAAARGSAPGNGAGHDVTAARCGPLEFAAAQ
jgi:hypothetical protein